jgi:PEP-CTERM motif
MHLRFLLFACFFLMLPMPVLAGTIYTYSYTGNTFTTGLGYSVGGYGSQPLPFGPFTTSDSVDVSFTLSSALGDNLSNTAITPASFTISDGVDTVTNAGTFNDEYFYIWTNASGQIVEWQIIVQTMTTDVGITTTDFPGATTTDSGSHQVGQYQSGQSEAFVDSDPGTWAMSKQTASDPPAATPEPSSLMLLGTGALGFAGLIRRKFAA